MSYHIGRTKDDGRGRIMKRYKCTKCGFVGPAWYWNETLRGQVMNSYDEFVPIQEAPADFTWKCPSCMNDVKVKEVE